MHNNMHLIKHQKYAVHSDASVCCTPSLDFSQFQITSQNPCYIIQDL